MSNTQQEARGSPQGLAPQKDQGCPDCLVGTEPGGILIVTADGPSGLDLTLLSGTCDHPHRNTQINWGWERAVRWALPGPAEGRTPHGNSLTMHILTECTQTKSFLLGSS